MKNIMVSNFKKNIILIFVFLLTFNCKKQEHELNILKLTELSNYKITKTKINDSIVKVYGENENYIIEGELDTTNNTKQKWWKIKNKNNNDWAAIEYIYLDKQIENQIKIYKNGMLDKKSSKFYEVSFSGQECKLNFYFPVSKYNVYNVDFGYITSDTIQKKRIRNGEVRCRKENKNNSYMCSLTLNNTENMVMGVTTEFSKLEEKDSTILATSRIYVKALRK